MASVRQAALLVAAVIAVNVMSLLDAVSTSLLLVDESYREINPLMQGMFDDSFARFLVV